MRGTTQRGQRWTFLAGCALLATALACLTAIEIALLVSIDAFCTRFANNSLAPSRPPASRPDENKDLDVIFWSIMFTCADRQANA